MKGYKITACCPNECVAQSFVEHWHSKGYEANAIERVMISDDGTRLGSWVVIRSTKPQK